MAKEKEAEDIWISVAEAAAAMNVHEVTFRRWINDGKVRIKRSENPTRIVVSSKWMRGAIQQRSALIIEPTADLV